MTHASSDQHTVWWNWKTALCSGLYRSPAFFAKSVQGGFTEFALLAIVAGFTGAWIQRVRLAQNPLWTRVVVLFLVPLCLHLSEAVVHTIAGTPGRKTGILVSMTLSAVSCAFNWHVMRHGAMLAGGRGDSFWTDLRRVPGLILSFLAWIIGRGQKTPEQVPPTQQ